METNIQLVNQSELLNFDENKITLIKNTIAPNLTNQELELFLYQCKRTGLDPLTRQIYAIKMGDKVSIQSSIDGFRLIAERSGKYAGQTAPVWYDKDGKTYEVWNKPNEYPYACKVGIHRTDFKEPLYAIAKWDSYVPLVSGKVGYMWNKMPDLMISKCAEALGLRKAFPQELSGIYSSDEMAQTEHQEIINEKEIKKTKIKKVSDDDDLIKFDKKKFIEIVKTAKDINQLEGLWRGGIKKYGIETMNTAKSEFEEIRKSLTEFNLSEILEEEKNGK